MPIKIFTGRVLVDVADFREEVLDKEEVPLQLQIRIDLDLRNFHRVAALDHGIIQHLVAVAVRRYAVDQSEKKRVIVRAGDRYRRTVEVRRQLVEAELMLPNPVLPEIAGMRPEIPHQD